jgi:preprotein translocase subunit SecG
MKKLFSILGVAFLLLIIVLVVNTVRDNKSLTANKVEKCLLETTGDTACTSP